MLHNARPAVGGWWVGKMPKAKLTERHLSRLQPGKARHWDTETPGLFVVVGNRNTVFWCKVDRREVRIGRSSDWTLEQARDRCRQIRRGERQGPPNDLPTLKEAFELFAAVRLAKRRPRTAIGY